MKATDLVLNGEYLSNAAKEWTSDIYTGTGYRQVKRVRVLDVQPGTWIADRDHGYVRGSSYSYLTRRGVFVAVLDAATGEFRCHDVVTTASIRGPWDTTWATVQDNARKASEARRERNAANTAAHARMHEVIRRLEGLADFHTGMYLYDGEQAIVHVTVLERLAQRLEDAE